MNRSKWTLNGAGIYLEAAKKSLARGRRVGYDFGSVMHYTAYQNHGDVIVMLPTDPRYLHTMGNNYGPVFSDLLAMNKYYNCQMFCPKIIDCKNEGFKTARIVVVVYALAVLAVQIAVKELLENGALLKTVEKLFRLF
uniref:Peptidase M12A domain-containing protein n=1 Tax=Ditylenchus dipsaci TaxID=166011 RepID=A0A915D6Y4_9BILA